MTDGRTGRKASGSTGLRNQLDTAAHAGGIGEEGITGKREREKRRHADLPQESDRHGHLRLFDCGPG